MIKNRWVREKSKGYDEHRDTCMKIISKAGKRGILEELCLWQRKMLCIPAINGYKAYIF